MMVNILMVEDDKNQQDLYKDYLEDNQGLYPQFNIIFCSNASDAINQLNGQKFDALFLDLLLDGDSNSTLIGSGNNVLDYILGNNVHLVVYIVSSTLHSLKPEYNDLFDNPLMRKFSRDTETSDVFSDLKRVLNTGVFNILGRSGKLEKLINEIYFQHLIKGFNTWIQKGRPCEDELLRYVTLHLIEHLDLPNEESSTTYFEPEFYIYPPIKRDISTGDIILYGDELFILLTPACDIEPRVDKGITQRNVEILVLAKIVKLDKQLFEQLNVKYSKGNNTDAEWNTYASNLRKNGKARFHFLPKYLEIEESVIDFKRLKYLNLHDYLNSEITTRKASVSTPFIRDIQSRFSAYFGRQGQPNGAWTS